MSAHLGEPEEVCEDLHLGPERGLGVPVLGGGEPGGRGLRVVITPRRFLAPPHRGRGRGTPGDRGTRAPQSQYGALWKHNAMNLQIFTVLSTLSAYLPGDGVQAAVEGPGVVMVHLGGGGQQLQRALPAQLAQ